jgi:hypothetical protein
LQVRGIGRPRNGRQYVQRTGIDRRGLNAREDTDEGDEQT